MDKIRFKSRKSGTVNSKTKRIGNANNSCHHATNTRHAPGEIYIILACGYHGIFPGCFLQRCKIGLTVDAKSRLKRLESIQAPCDYKLLKTIRVRDMAAVESLLHKRFSSSNVPLKRSREWFDLNIWQLWCACQAFQHYESNPRYGINRVYRFPFKAIALAFTGFLVVIAVFKQLNLEQHPPQPENIKRGKW